MPPDPADDTGGELELGALAFLPRGFFDPISRDLFHEFVWNRPIERKLDGTLSLFVLRQFFLDALEARVDRVESNVALEGGEIDQPLAIQFECGNLVADRLDGAGSRLLDRLPHFFQDALNILWKRLDVSSTVLNLALSSSM